MKGRSGTQEHSLSRSGELVSRPLCQAQGLSQGMSSQQLSNSPAASAALKPPSLPAAAPALPSCAYTAPRLSAAAHLLHHVLVGLDGGLLTGDLIKLAREGPTAARGQDKM